GEPRTRAERGRPAAMDRDPRRVHAGDRSRAAGSEDSAGGARRSRRDGQRGDGSLTSMSMTTESLETTADLQDHARRPSRGRRSSGRKLRRAGWLMVTPALAHTIVWIAIPVVATFVLSFTNYEVFSAPEFIGLDNYVELWNDDVFRKATWNTV